MKIFLISNMFPDKDSPGYGIFVKNILEGLKKQNVEIVVSALIRGKSKSLKEKLVKYIIFYKDIFRCFFKKYDFIYIHFPNQALPLLLLLWGWKRKKVVVNLHGEDLLYRGLYGSLLGKLNDFFLSKVDLVVVPSEYFKRIVVGRIRGREDKVFVSPSGGIDEHLFYPLPKKKLSYLHLGFVGRIEEEKGIVEFVKAISILSGQIACKATIIGYGKYEQQLKSLITRYKLNASVHLLKGVPQAQLAEYYNIFDLFVFPTKRNSESLGLVGIEAMACKVPVIGSDIGGIPSYLRNGYNGYLVKAGDVDGIVNAILDYFNLSKEEKQQMAENCLSTAKNYYRDCVAVKLADKFNQVLI